MTKHWAVQDAKAKFSELLRAAEKEPQVISYRGEPKFEVRLKNEPVKEDAVTRLPRWWTEAPKIKGGLKLPLRKGKMRKVHF